MASNKRRDLLLVGQTRIHFDEVQGLWASSSNWKSCFVPTRIDPEEGEAAARRLMTVLEIDASDLIAAA